MSETEMTDFVVSVPMASKVATELLRRPDFGAGVFLNGGAGGRRSRPRVGYGPRKRTQDGP